MPGRRKIHRRRAPERKGPTGLPVILEDWVDAVFTLGPEKADERMVGIWEASNVGVAAYLRGFNGGRRCSRCADPVGDLAPHDLCGRCSIGLSSSAS